MKKKKKKKKKILVTNDNNYSKTIPIPKPFINNTNTNKNNETINNVKTSDNFLSSRFTLLSTSSHLLNVNVVNKNNKINTEIKDFIDEIINGEIYDE
jgi:hypothetical protein